MRERASSTTKLRPPWRSAFAAGGPGAPAPTTATSTSGAARPRPAIASEAAPPRKERREIRIGQVRGCLCRLSEIERRPATNAATLASLSAAQRRLLLGTGLRVGAETFFGPGGGLAHPRGGPPA